MKSNSSFWCCYFLLPAIIAAGLVLSPARILGAEAAEAPVASPGRAERFEADGVRFCSDFPSAQVSEYVRLDADQFELTIRPENTPINNSAWYAFQVVADQAKTIVVRLTYENGIHRYHPKISHDGRSWSPLDDDAIERTKDKRQAVLRLQVDTQPLWVAAQELVDRHALESWMDRLAALPFARQSVIGRSIDGRPIYLVQITESDDPGHVVIIGRQHPPEITGTLALMAFVDRLVEDDAMAAGFRRAFQLHVVSLVNPDGVDRGHWRHNVNGVDLNRDWGPFAQPETRAVRDHVMSLHQPPDQRIYLWLDFHSTHQDVFYTQPDEAEAFPPDFTRQWLDALDARTPGYSVRRSASLGTRPTSQQWAYNTFGAPAITYEFGDNTDRAQLRRVARIAAEEMMRLLVPSRQLVESATP